MEKASVVASTGTTIGLEIGQSPANATPGLKFGYSRAEVAVVSEKLLEGANDTNDIANVIMELRYSSDKANAPGVYQRLAVGKQAVGQAGAKFMFAKSADGKVDQGALDAIESTLDDEQFDQGNGSADEGN